MRRAPSPTPSRSDRKGTSAEGLLGAARRAAAEATAGLGMAPEQKDRSHRSGSWSGRRRGNQGPRTRQLPSSNEARRSTARLDQHRQARQPPSTLEVLAAHWAAVRKARPRCMTRQRPPDPGRHSSRRCSSREPRHWRTGTPARTPPEQLQRRSKSQRIHRCLMQARCSIPHQTRRLAHRTRPTSQQAPPS